MADASIRVSIVGLGTVGRWVLDAIAAQEAIDLNVVALANRRDGFVFREEGIDVEEALACVRSNTSLPELDGVEHWPTASAGLEATETDIVVEVSQSPMTDGEPGLSHMRQALLRGNSVATSNKWPVALAGVELRQLAADRGVGFRAESTVMSGTPVLAALTDGISGARPVRLRGVLNATVNSICSQMAEGAAYEEALAEAQAGGLAEPDPSADVDGLDSVAKVMVLSALVFGVQLEVADVERRGVSSVRSEEVAAALSQGQRLREVSTLDPAAGLHRVDMVALPASDPLAAVEGTQNKVVAEIDPLGEISVSGPGAGPELAGQGVFSDLLVLARQRGDHWAT